MSRLERDAIVAALRAEDVASHLGICALGDQRWRGRWLRSRSCAKAAHSSDAFGLARDGMWHCWSCDEGGDLLGLIAASENLDMRRDFGRVLEIAAGIAGIETDDPPDMFPPPPAPREPRIAAAPLPPIGEREAAAKRRAAWAWERLYDGGPGSLVDSYLKLRGLDSAAVMAREQPRATPLRIGTDMMQAIVGRDPKISDDMRTLWWTMGTRRGTMSIVVPVRSVSDGSFVDLRARRVEPEDGQPKIIGMVGGVTAAPAERGKARQLIGCYGNPHTIESDHVIIVEGLMDYLTALQVWPNAQILGAVEAGSLALVTAHAARTLASRDSTSRITVVEQCDPPRANKATGQMMSGAADVSINEDPNAASKVAIRHLGPGRIGWLFCQNSDAVVDGKPVKDLNDLVRAGLDVAGMVVRWTDLASPDE